MKSIRSSFYNIARHILISVSPAAFDKLFYLMKLKRVCNLKTPSRLSEKIMWLKRNWYDDKAVILADKYRVRKYLQEKGYNHMLIPLLAVYSSPDEFKQKELPRQFVLKASHGSGMNLICRSSSDINEKAVKKVIGKWLRTNYYYQCAEEHYAHMPPSVVCEKLMTQPGHASLTEYKIMCYNGVPKQIMVYYDRDEGSACSCVYDTHWNLIPVHSGIYERGDREVPKPLRLDEMLMFASEMSCGFPHLRVDLYEVSGHIYFGEFTFFHNAGVCCFKPDSYDKTFGEQLALPLKTVKEHE